MTRSYAVKRFGDGRLVSDSGGERRLFAAPRGDQWRGIHRDELRDFVAIASAVWAADRLAPRHAPGKSEAAALEWQRRIDLTVEVREPLRWTPLAGSMAELLGWLTDDRWKMSFTTMTAPPKASKLPLFEPPRGEVCLFSGGLDSVVGLHLRAMELQSLVVPVCIVRNNVDERHVRRDAADALKSLGHACEPIRHVLRAHKRSEGEVADSREELSQRSRGFVFLLNGAAVALSAGVHRLHVYEPGAGAFNPAMSAAQVGSFNTRAMHPSTLARVEKLISDALGVDFQIEAPFIWSTKAEMVRQAGAALPGLATEALSCDRGYGRRADWRQHCGWCTSCLLRRSALFVALGDADPTRYQVNAADLRARSSTASFRNLGYGLSNCRTYRDLFYWDSAIEEAWPYFERRGMSRAGFESELVDLMRRYGAEIEAWFRHEDARLAPITQGATP